MALMLVYRRLGFTASLAAFSNVVVAVLTAIATPPPPFETFVAAQYTQDYKLALSKLCELRVQVLQHWLTAEQVGPPPSAIRASYL